jgi:hypothetical protein
MLSHFAKWLSASARLGVGSVESASTRSRCLTGMRRCVGPSCACRARRTEACTDTSEGVSGLVGLGGPLDPGDGPLVIFLKFHQPFFYFHRVLKWLSHFLLQWLSYFFATMTQLFFFILSVIFEISSRGTVAQPFFATLAQSFFKFCRPFFRFCRMLQWLTHFFLL